MNRLRFSPIIILLLTAVGLVACISASQIEESADQQFSQMRSELPLSDDAALRRYVSCVADSIVAQLPEPYRSYDWQLEVFDDEMINAFAMPGGNIGVFTGIFKVAHDQDQLATVIGHEIAHVTEEHSLERANRESVSVGAAVLGSIFVAQTTGVDPTDAVMFGLDFGFLRPYGRAQESEADLKGLKFMASAGFDPRASVSLWTNMAAENPDAPPEWMSTHPSEQTRITALALETAEVMPLYETAQSAGLRPDCEP